MPQSFDAPGSSVHGAAPSRKNRASSTSQTHSRVLSPTSGTPAGGAKFPRIDECAHFHYETVECGKVQLILLDEAPDGTRVNGSADFGKPKHVYWLKVKCKGNEWFIRRVAQQFKTLDELLHECVYDRRFTQLPLLRNIDENEENFKPTHELLKKYVARLSELPEGQMYCAPVLHWFDMDNRGRNLVAALREIADINIPAVAAAHAVRRYTAQSAEELSLEVGDMVSIIDMTDSNWWRGKCRLRVGSFPAQCVRRISDAKQAEAVPAASNLPSSPPSSSPPSNINVSRTKPIMKKHGKIMEFLRSFLVTRPTKSRLKQSGILKERVFGCDLGEYLHNCGDEVPVVVKDCTDFVQKYGIVDGIYRISGVSSHVRNLRHEYDCERRPNLNRDPSGKGEQSLCDPHSVAGLCKLYFRELPNPLLTYQLYDRFAQAINAPEDDRLLKIHDVIQQLPPPHYRTLKHLAIHLQEMAHQDSKTSMHCRNLAIVWAPNLLRSRDLEAGLAAFTEARVQSVVTEFLISNADLLFSEKLQNMQYDSSRGRRPPRPKSLMVLSAPKLISLEEAQARCKAGGVSEPSSGRFARNIDDTKQDEFSQHDVYRRKSSSPPSLSYKRSNTSPTSPVAIIPLSSGTQSILNKRRQSMDPKLTGSRPQHNFPSNSRHYASQHSGWRSKLGSFLRKGNALQQNEDSEEPSGKPDRKVPLRRSQSDDSLLSAHSSRQDIDRIEDVVSQESKDTESAEKLFPSQPTMRQAQSPRSPRPRGRIFVVSDDKLASTHDSNDPSALQPKKASQAREAGFVKSNTPGTPESIPTPSIGTTPSSHGPFSGLDSDFPGVMREGLDFNPLQYSPTISSPEPEIPEIPHDRSHHGLNSNADIMDNANSENDPKGSENISVSGTEIVKEERNCFGDGVEQNKNVREKTEGKELESLALKSKYVEDILNANVEVKEKLVIENANDHLPAYPTNQVNNNSNKNKSLSKENNKSTSLKGSSISSENKPKDTKRPIDSYYWKAEPVDTDCSNISDIENCRSGLGVRNNKSPGSKKVYPPINLELRDYSVHYTCNQHKSNGRMRQSITATFVQDRSRGQSVRQPHSIVRSMDVPPTVQPAHKPLTKRHSQGHPYHHNMNNFPIAKRHQAYAVLRSLHHRNSVTEPKRLHCRSLSAGNELDFQGHTDKQKPTPLPRHSSSAGFGRPVPLPRRRLHVGSEKHSDVKNATSAPSTPIDRNTGTEFPEACLFSSANPQNQTKINREAKRIGSRENIQESPFEFLDDHFMKPRHAKANSTSADLSPPDSICASTAPSWV